MYYPLTRTVLDICNNLEGKIKKQKQRGAQKKIYIYCRKRDQLQSFYFSVISSKEKGTLESGTRSVDKIRCGVATKLSFKDETYVSPRISVSDEIGA